MNQETRAEALVEIVDCSRLLTCGNNWMGDALGSPLAFIGLSLLLPTLSVILTVLWFKRWGLI